AFRVPYISLFPSRHCLQVVREAAYVTTSKDVGKWQQVVLQNRRAEQLARTPLEQEIFELLHKTQQPITDPLLTPEEAASLQAMSLEEARQRRAELQKARAVQSYYEAKARREKKIKSKKYHRVLKKSKRRKALKEFELLQKSDPEERMSLKHQNKGKWARSRAIMAKYDLQARKAMQEQLDKNKELTQKGVPAEEPEVREGPGDDVVPDAAESKEQMEEEEEELSEEEALLQDFAQRRQTRQQKKKGGGEPQGT
ncbi:PREDICTED: U3 small nucleolar RNA-associated protein 14 homolog A-like, partial [Apaloderma vittatum]|uniref:U3 small nucleolar RNA-associated protein 14 homolog A-like n=1 Tax=Apaloderma vittatum TaxID=57397 RepID=UPI0005212AE0